MKRMKCSRSKAERETLAYDCDLAKSYMVNSIRTFNRMFKGRVQVNMANLTVTVEEGMLLPMVEDVPIQWRDMYPKGTSNAAKSYIASA